MEMLFFEKNIKYLVLKLFNSYILLFIFKSRAGNLSEVPSTHIQVSIFLCDSSGLSFCFCTSQNKVSQDDCFLYFWCYKNTF